MKSSFFDQITDPANIRKAYLDLSKKFDQDSKTRRYRGVDGLSMPDLDFISEEIFAQIRDEMITFREIAPAYMVTIPKKSGKGRKIFVYAVKERIKAEAIYCVLEPFFDRYFSDFLYSYRSSHDSYYAARSSVRRYKRYYGQNHVLVTDIVDYSENIDHDLLLQKIMGLGFDTKTVLLLELFIKTRRYENGVLTTPVRGLLTGTPLYALLSNFYMDEFDKWAGKRVAFYRRVGDDMIAMDKDVARIRDVHAKLLQTVKALRLRINEKKAALIRDTDPFKFLGYRFQNGLVGFEENSISRVKSRWRKALAKIPGDRVAGKIRGFERMNRGGSESPDYLFGRIMQQKRLVDHAQQVKSFSDSLAGALASFLFGYDNPQKRRQAARMMQDFGARSLFKQYAFFRSRKKQ